MIDEISGWPSQERDIDPIIRKAGSAQLIHAPQRADVPRLAPNANRVQPGRLPTDHTTGYPDRATKVFPA